MRRSAAQLPLLLCLLGAVLLPWAASARPATAQQAAPSADSPLPRLVDASAGSGITFRHRYGSLRKIWPTEFGGSGGGWIDYDLDGRIDLVLINGLDDFADDPIGATTRSLAGAPDASTGNDDTLGHRLYRNGPAGFEELSGTGIEDRVWGDGIAVGDVDNDGFPDVYVTAIGPNRLYRNNGDGTFSPWTAGAEDERWSTSASLTDWNGDGWLDLYVVNYVTFDPVSTAKQGDGVCNYRGVDVFCGPEGLEGSSDALYLNRGDGTFEPVDDPPIDPERTYGFAIVATDCDGDLRPEVFVAADSTMNLLYSRIEEQVDDMSLYSGAGYSGAGREQAGMGVTAGDFDDDGDMDLFVTNFQSDYNTLYRNIGDCFFEDVSEPLGLGGTSLPFMGWAPQFVDIDGDADLDLYVANGHIYPQLDDEGLEPYEQRNLLYLNRLRDEGEARFDEVGEQADEGMDLVHGSRAALAGDFDDDFDIDILVTNINGTPDLLRNDTPMSSPMLRLSLIGRGGNRTAYGARISVTSGDIEQTLELRGSEGYAGSNDPRLLVALPGGRAERVVIAWRDGATTRLDDVAPGWIVVDEQRGIIARRDP
ncbi:MAG: CRTAC1 family protein [Acidobacteriota bacterium]|jgi:hypothetical protein